ncbi:NAD(P)-dependent oxidoreductase [Asticcacaulis solisilvae]|uniref:NAD(P)-dependent oxidoreductase n=1 Tax=Asticcacaulis solisilvae TaxID=1217274 RepID=UPI003FD73AE0
MNIGFIGLGSMGAAIVPNLLIAGHAVKVWNRTASKAEALVEKGAILTATPGEAARDADVVFTMVADDKALEGVTFGGDGILANLKKGGIHVSMSTVGVALVERLGIQHAAAHQGFVAAPVFGRPAAAAAGQLFIAAAGAPEALDAVAPLFGLISQKVFAFGDNPVSAALVKLAGNFMIVSVTEQLGEAMALLGKGGVDKAAFLDFMTSTLFNSLIYKNYGALIASQTFEPVGFAAVLGAKDVGLVKAAADGLNVPLPLADLLSDRLARLVAEGGGNLDLTALSKLSVDDAK